MTSANSLFLPKRLADAYFLGAYKGLLVTSVPSESDLDTFDFRSDITNECPNSGTYAAGGATVTCSVGAVDTTNNRVPVTFGSPAAWTSATLSAVGMWIYKVIGSAATDELVGFIDFGGTITSTAGPFTATISAPLYVTR
jgi:hypothetical protein